MENERIRILKMLEEGRINADEAARLLDASRAAPGRERESRAHETVTDGPRGNDGPGRGPAPAGFDEFAGAIGRKFEALARDLEPRLRKATEIVVEKTTDIADRVSKSIEASRADVFRAGDGAPAPKTTAVGGGRVSERSFERRVTESGGELHLAGLNAPLNVKGYNGDTISLKVTCSAKRAAFSGDGVQFMQLGGKYTLLYDEHEFDSVAVDAFVPAAAFGFIAARTVNAGLTVSGVTCKNGRLDNFNGGVTVNNTDIENMEITTSNSAVVLSIGEFSAFSDYAWAIETSNGKVSLHLPSAPQYGYHIRARAPLSTVRIGLTGMNFLHNDGPNAEAASLHFDSKPKRVRMSVETSYAPINVN